MEQDPTRICELLVGLGDVDVVGVDDEATEPLVVHIQTRSRPVCGGCGGLVRSKGTSLVRLVDLPAFGRAVRLVWRKWRWRCPAAGCGVASFTETNDRSVNPPIHLHKTQGTPEPVQYPVRFIVLSRQEVDASCASKARIRRYSRVPFHICEDAIRFNLPKVRQTQTRPRIVVVRDCARA